MPTLEQIQAKMKKLQVQADALIAKKAQAAVDQIRKIMLAHGLTTEDIEAKAKAKREAKAANGSASKVKVKAASSLKSKTPPKYLHPKTGATWTGHGRAPAWIAEVKDRSKFLIASGAEATVASDHGYCEQGEDCGQESSRRLLPALVLTGDSVPARSLRNILTPKLARHGVGRGRHRRG
jgi:DNA-binding protein H-NS